jgi:hypothetical protein
LAASDESSPTAATIPIVLLVGGLRLDNALYDLFDVADFDEDVFGLEVSMNDAAFPMEVVKTEQNLLCDLLDEGHRDAAMVPALDQAK